MRPNSSFSLGKQQGSSLLIALMLLIIGLLFALSLSKQLNEADEQITLEVWGTRALLTANSGAEIALATLFPLDGSVRTDCRFVPSAWIPPKEVGFAQCQVAISCQVVPITDATMTHYQFTLKSAATCEAGQCRGLSDDCLRVHRQVAVNARVSL